MLSQGRDSGKHLETMTASKRFKNKANAILATVYNKMTGELLWSGNGKVQVVAQIIALRDRQISSYPESANDITTACERLLARNNA